MDLIASGLSPFAPDKAAVRAGRIMLAEIRRRVTQGESFSFETILSGRMYERLIPKWQAAGYRVRLIYLDLPNADFAVTRVAARVANGGHAVPEEIIRRRFDRGLALFHGLYKNLADSWTLYDNSGPVPGLVAEGGKYEE